ncbi:MAG: PKD domain-containing protein [Flavobacteriales bacterium]|nr:PKD domain-containing protein [Flavobacteriales bacterium]
MISSSISRIKRLLYSIAVPLLFILGFGYEISAQLPWTEGFGDDFTPCNSEGQVADGYPAEVSGNWTVEVFGAQGFFSNLWYVSSQEAGGIDPGVDPCGSQCSAGDDNFNRSLHIGAFDDAGNPNDGDAGAIYVEIETITFTDKRVVSPVIDCTGEYVITLNMTYAAGANANDFATVDYFDGTSWTELQVLPETGVCSANSISWANYSIELPASANDNPDVQIGFRWQNNEDEVTQPLSVAIDDIELSAGPAPNLPEADFFVVDDENEFCENNCIQFNSSTTFDPDFSNGPGSASYEWTFEGGDPATSTDPAPVVCYDDPGLFDVTLVVTDNLGEGAPELKTDFIEVLDCGPTIDIEASQTVACANEECIDFTDLSVGYEGNEVESWFWTFESADGSDVQNSSQQNPSNICLNTVGFYTVTLEASDASGTEVETFNNYIEVLDCSGPDILDCSGPDIAFEADRTIICPGQCIQFTDMSTSFGTILSWEWDIPGGQAEGEDEPGISTQQNPLVCYDTPGTYNVTLSAVDQEGPSAITQTISITVDPCTGPPDIIDVIPSETEICPGDCVDFQSQVLGLSEDYLWVFTGVDGESAVSTEANPEVICYFEPGSYNVTLTVSNSNNEIDTQTFDNLIIVEDCSVPNPPVPRFSVSADTICAGTCVDYTDESTGIGVNSWLWNFEGAVAGSGTSTSQNPTNICYNQAGTYAVSLEVEGAGGDSTRFFTDVITVTNNPECRPAISVSAPDTLCAGDCAEFNADFMNADSVLWTFNGGTPETSTAFNPGSVCFEEEGQYNILVQAWNAAGAANPSVINLFVGERPPLDAGPDRTINAGAAITLNANVGTDEPLGEFEWQPFEQVDNFSAQSVEVSPDETTQFIVYYQEPGTCTAIDTVTVNVNFRQAIGVPSAFSPNGDGVNDVLHVLGQGISKMRFRIFNRYGQLVFESFDQADGWDGTKDGKELNPATFVYTLDVTFADGGEFEVMTGDVTLTK